MEGVKGISQYWEPWFCVHEWLAGLICRREQLAWNCPHTVSLPAVGHCGEVKCTVVFSAGHGLPGVGAECKFDCQLATSGISQL